MSPPAATPIWRLPRRAGGARMPGVDVLDLRGHRFRRGRERGDARRHRAAPRAGRAVSDVRQPSRIRAGAAVSRLRVDRRLSELRRSPRLSPGDAAHALPLLRRAEPAAGALPGLRRGGHAAHRTRHAAGGGSSAHGAPWRPGGPHGPATAPAGGARSRPFSNECMAARSTSWSAPRCSPRDTTFPNVTLVGILDADCGLFGADFRSNRTDGATPGAGRGALRAWSAARGGYWFRPTTRGIPCSAN